MGGPIDMRTGQTWRPRTRHWLGLAACHAAALESDAGASESSKRTDKVITILSASVASPGALRFDKTLD